MSQDPYDIKTLEEFKQLASDFLKRLEIVKNNESINGMLKILGIAYIHVPLDGADLAIAQSLYLYCAGKALEAELSILMN